MMQTLDQEDHIFKTCNTDTPMMYQAPKEQLPLFLGERRARSLTAEPSLVR